MKRPRNVDCGKIRRPLKRSKITDGIYGSTFLYLRFLLVWALVLMADFILEFRFEYLWPFWLLLRSVYDSFKYQGLAFSVFFVCIAITSDVICYLFIPVQWLFFAASTYVWVQYVWHTERGICLPTVSLWLLFVYIEASVRLRELKSIPFNLDLCRPFAAHCIGYPVVTLGFGFKSYVSYRMRLRRQKVVQKENEFYMQILQQALPPEIQYADKPKALPSKVEEEIISNGVPGKKLTKGEEEKDGKKLSSSSSSPPSTKSADVNEDDEVEYIEKSLPKKQPNVNQFDENSDSFSSDQQTKAFKTSNSVAAVSAATSCPSPSVATGPNKPVSKQLNSSKDNSAKKGKNYWKEQLPPAPPTFTNNKDEHICRLESDVKKLKADLQSSRNCEQELRVQINSQMSSEKSTRSELYQLQQDNENLQNKLHNLVTGRQQDKAAVASLERRLAEEKRARAAVEQQLQAERKAKKAEEAAAARAVAMAAAARSGECTDSCKARRRDLENDIKQLRRDLKIREDQVRQLEREVQSLRQYKDAQKEAEVLLKALSALQDKNVELENSLSAETRFKQDLFSALGEERRVIKILQNTIREKDCEITELKSKIAEVMALIPSTSSSYQSQRTSSPLFSSTKFCQEDLAVASDLNPNASDYTPKTTI